MRFTEFPPKVNMWRSKTVGTKGGRQYGLDLEDLTFYFSSAADLLYRAVPFKL